MDGENTIGIAEDGTDIDAQGGDIEALWDGGADSAEDTAGEWDLSDTPDGTPGGAGERFTLKHLGRQVEVTRDEVIALAQKGRDYDRIRERADELTHAAKRGETLEAVLREVAARTNTPAEELIDGARADIIARSEGVSREEALIRARGERLGGVSPEVTQRRVRERKRDSEISEFMSVYGGRVEPSAIPREVWGEVSSGKPLLFAYQSYENRRLREELASARLSGENSSRSSGSRSGDGVNGARGELESDWYSD
jgi:hypothetical protein